MCHSSTLHVSVLCVFVLRKCNIVCTGVGLLGSVCVSGREEDENVSESVCVQLSHARFWQAV